MRIGIDTRDLLIARTGAKTYLEESIAAFQSMPGLEVVCLSPQQFSSGRKRNSFKKIADQGAFIRWKQFDLPRLAKQQGCDLLFCTDYTVPLYSSIPAIPVFYDANFWINPTQYNWLWRKSLNLLALPAAKKAPAVVTISEFARADIIAYTGIRPEQIHAIHIAPKTQATITLPANDIQAILNQHQIDPTKPFILHVGVLEKRKNLARLVEAFAIFSQQASVPHQLVLVGQPGPRADMDDSENVKQKIAQLQLGDSVKLIGYVPDDSLAAFYQGASMYVFPSLREGFGIPVLEAYSQNLPVAAATGSAMPEIAGDAALLFDPYDPQAIASAMLRIAEDATLRHDLIEKGKLRRQDFGWDKTAQRLISLFENVVNQKK